jgi:hypothetical protein
MSPRTLLHSLLLACFHLLAAVSLLIFVGAGVLWIRSLWIGDTINIYRGHSQFMLQTTRAGSIDLGLNTPISLVPEISHFRRPMTPYDGKNAFDRPQLKFAGIGVGWPSPGWPYYWVRLPFWCAMILSAILPAWWIVWYRRRRHLKFPGLCAKCGYDLRASAHRCPECGTPIPPGTPIAPLH